MRPSRRKDVIIARVIFAFICLAVAAIIGAVIILISARFKNAEVKPKESQATEKETESQEDLIDQIPIVPATEEEIVITEVRVKTTTGVKLRSETNTESEVLTVVPEGTELVVITEEDGWAKVKYDGYTGYVFTEYVQQVSGAEEEASSDERE